MITLQNIIDGNAVTSDARLPFFDPRTGAEIGTAPNSDVATVDLAFRSAERAFKAYKRTTPSARQHMLLQLADAVEANVERLLDAEVACTGKPRNLTRDIEILRGADQLRFFAGACRIVSGTAQAEYIDGFSSTIRREPRGVIAQITPWNYPFMMAIWKIGPALAAGNTLVIKPAETTPWSTLVLAELAQEIFPPGVVNVICGDRETGAAMVSHPVPDMVSITGSTRAGAQVMSAASGTLKDVHLELGGKAPALVFTDVDVATTASQIAMGAFFNAGQDCTAVTRVLVHEDIHDEFARALAAAAGKLAVGGDGGDLGPLNSEAQLERVVGFMDRLPSHIEVLVGGKATGQGFHFEPTVLKGAQQQDEVVCQEIFGPIVTVQSFASEDEAVDLANDSQYGLASSVWSRDHGVVSRVSLALDFGTVWINCHQVIPAEAPHGGFKQSGTGKDLSVFGVEDYTRIKSVTTSLR